MAYHRIPNDLEGVETLPEILRQQGYVTFATGKWHNQRPSFLRSFSQAKKVFFGGMTDHTKVLIEDLSSDGILHNKRIGGKFSSQLFADAVIGFLKTPEKGQPFYAYVAFTAPHDPRQPPESFRDRYYEERPPLPKNFLPQHPFDNGWLVVRDEELAAWPRTREVISDQLAEYYGLISHLDEQIGRILEALEASGEADNTYIVYAADHGLAMGSHGLLGKQSLYEHSMRAPLIIAGPGIPGGESSESLTYLLDIFPTILGLAGAPVPSPIDGRSLAPIWRGETDSVREALFLSFTDSMRAVRYDRWKLIVYPQVNHLQLFNLDLDPNEIVNLADDPAQADRIARLTVLLEEWQEQLGDDQALSSEDPGPLEIDLTGREREPDHWQPNWIIEKYFDLSSSPDSSTEGVDLSGVLLTLDGKEVSLADNQGKVLFLNFWATWCGPCRTEMPSMAGLYGLLKEDGLSMVAVTEEPRELVVRYLEHHPYPFPVMIDSTGELTWRLRVIGLPTTFVLDEDRRVIYSHVGGAEWDTPSVVDLFREALGK